MSVNSIAVLEIYSPRDKSNLKDTVHRTDFEKCIAPIIARLDAPIKKAIANARVSISDVDTVEMIGGSTRIPIVKEALAKFFGGSLDGENKLSTTLKQDKEVVLGCTIQCELLIKHDSGAVISDWNAFPVEIILDKCDKTFNHTPLVEFYVADYFPMKKVKTQLIVDYTIKSNPP